MSEGIILRYESVKERIKKACESCGRDPDEITLVAVSKTKPDRDVLKLLQHGQVHFGENRAKALEDRMDSVSNPSAIWHFIGNLQTNKIKYMVHRVNWIESIHKKKALKEVEKRASEIDRVINVLIQVNISGEGQKSGCEPDHLDKILRYAQSLQYTRVKGLMGMATFADDPETVRPEFRLLRELRDSHRQLENGSSVQLDELSMGMTNDLEIAISEGATMVRIGTAIFGERNY